MYYVALRRLFSMLDYNNAKKKIFGDCITCLSIITLIIIKLRKLLYVGILLLYYYNMYVRNFYNWTLLLLCRIIFRYMPSLLVFWFFFFCFEEPLCRCYLCLKIILLCDNTDCWDNKAYFLLRCHVPFKNFSRIL